MRKEDAFSCARMSEVDFEAVRLLCQEDPRFPASYAQWQEQFEAGARECLAPVVIRADEIRAWCKRVGVMPCCEALKLYVLLQLRVFEDGPCAPAEPRRNERRQDNQGPDASAAETT